MDNAVYVRIKVFAHTDRNPDIGHNFMVEGQVGDSMLCLIRRGLRVYPYEKVRQFADKHLMLNVDGENVMGNLHVNIGDSNSNIRVSEYVEYVFEEDMDELVTSNDSDDENGNENDPESELEEINLNWMEHY